VIYTCCQAAQSSLTTDDSLPADESHVESLVILSNSLSPFIFFHLFLILVFIKVNNSTRISVCTIDYYLSILRVFSVAQMLQWIQIQIHIHLNKKSEHTGHKDSDVCLTKFYVSMYTRPL